MSNFPPTYLTLTY